MPLYLAPYIGSGTAADPFIPVGGDQPDWTAIDMRPDPTVATGRALLYLPVAVVDPQLNEIGQDKDEPLANTVRIAFRNQFNKDLDTGWTLGEALGQLMLFPENGMKPLRPFRGLYEIWLNNVRWFLLFAPAGGSSYSDDFNRGDGDLGANWAAVPSFIEPTIVTNAVQPVNTLTSWSTVRYSAATFNDDQWASVSLAACVGGNSYVGPMVRGSNATQTVYTSRTNGPLDGATADGNIAKWVSGTGSTLWSFTNRNIATNTVVRLEARGSTLTRYENNVLIVNVTDSSIASGWAGLHVAADAGVAGDARADNWLGGDLEAAPVNPMFYDFPKQKLAEAKMAGMI